MTTGVPAPAAGHGVIVTPDARPLRDIMAKPSFQETFGALQGDAEVRGVGPTPDWQRMAGLVSLIREGHAHQLVL